MWAFYYEKSRILVLMVGGHLIPPHRLANDGCFRLESVEYYGANLPSSN